MNLTLETLIYQLSPQLSLKELRSLCQTTPELRQHCRNDRLWETRITLDFPQAGTKPANLSWFEFYIATDKSIKLINHQYPKAPQKPNGMSYIQYYQLLERAKLLQIFIGYGTAVAATIYIIPRITTIRNLLNDIDKILIANPYAYSIPSQINSYTLIFKTISWGKFIDIFTLIKDNDNIIINFDQAAGLEDGLFQQFYYLSNFNVDIIFTTNYNFVPYYLSNDQLDTYLLR